MYRCRFDIDTQLVPSGCSDDTPTPPADDTVQSPADAFTAITVGHSHSCALRNNGTITCWGKVRQAADPPAGAYTAIAAGSAHACALTNEGQAFCWSWRTSLPEGVSWVN